MSSVQTTYPLQTVLELACAAQRINKIYLKNSEPIYSNDGKLMSYRWDNKFLILYTLGAVSFTPGDDGLKPSLLRSNSEDTDLATEIKKYYRRLMFAAVKGDNEFLTEVNSLLNAEDIPVNRFGFIACLPSVYKRDLGRHQVEKKVRLVDDNYLANVGEHVADADCEILSCQRSKNFDAFNVDAIIDNKMVSWMSKIELQLGPAVIIKAKIKDHTKHWKYQNSVTRLNYVKAAQ